MDKKTSKRLVLAVKVVILLAVLGGVGYAVWKAWWEVSRKAGEAHMVLSWGMVDWRYGILAVLGFCGVMLTSGSGWRWLAWRMGDRSPTLRMLGAYTFSQMGKYVPGKVALLLMRIERSGRYGMSAGVCTLSTLLENMLYMISGGLVGMFAIAHVAGELSPVVRPFLWPLAIAGVVVLAVACHPAVFYGLVGMLLKKMKRPGVKAEQRLGAGTLAVGIFSFLPCWVFGGFALWASACCLHPIPIAECGWFAGAFSLSVIIGMASLLPGGTGIREAVLGAAVGLQLAPVLGHDQAILVGAVAAVLQRVFQLVAEMVLGVAGAAATGRRAAGDAAVTTGAEIKVR